MLKHVSMSDIEKLSRKSALTLYGLDERLSDVDMPSKSNVDLNKAPEVSTGGNPNDKNHINTPACSSNGSIQLDKPLEKALKILRVQASQPLPFLFRSELARIAGIKGMATLLKAEKAALQSGYIIRHEIARARTKIVLWEITDLGYQALNIVKPVWRSKGEYRHKFCAYRIADAKKRKGHRAQIEYRQSNGKLIDVAIFNGENPHYIEICASYPLEKELINLEKNLIGDAMPSEITFAVTERRMKVPLIRLIEEYLAANPVSCPVKVVLAGDLIASVEEER